MSRFELLTDVEAAHAAGLCVLPPRPDGTKHPIVNWLRYQHERPTLDQLHSWYRDDRLTGIGIVPGPVSGHLEMFEAEDFDTLQRFRTAMAVAGERDLIARLDAGYLETSPGGGVHWLYRCEPSERNHRIACRPKRLEEMRHPKDKRQVLLETRGAGGYAVVAPSFGAVHPTGRPYVRIAGTFATIPAITVAERARLWAVGESLDEMPPVRLPERSPSRPRPKGAGETPMERFNREASWSEILEPHGWTRAGVIGNRQAWCRPGKHGATSATVTDDTVLYVFSSSTDFEPDRGYSKFAAYAVLSHAGDMIRAARALRSWWKATI